MWVHERERERERDRQTESERDRQTDRKRDSRFQERNCSRWKLRGNRLMLNILSNKQDPGSRSHGRVQEAYCLCNKVLSFNLLVSKRSSHHDSLRLSCLLLPPPKWYMPSQSLPCEFHDTALCVWHWGQIDWQDSWAQETLCSVSLTGQLDTRDTLLCQFDRTTGHTRHFALSVWQDNWTHETLCSVSLTGQLDTRDT